MMCFKTEDAEKSIWAFSHIVAPALRNELDLKKIISTEKHDSELDKHLDLEQCIDGIFVDVSGASHFYANRIQFGTNYKTFTLRRSRPTGATTEYDKLKQAVRDKAIKPTYHVQTYIEDNGKWQTATTAVAETDDLIQYVESHKSQWHKTSDGDTFYYIPWSDLGNKVTIFTTSGNLTPKKK